ncbi:hypothetical protein V5P93_002931 [Actinokineospora auranticolor]|uniref:hypothetical protein n=1 Tax=Actinokineospora auranticolor TaxID=155976 RepID=UPI001FE56796|nr:hypothetical protein [Actinokineospora auranticolor]
MADDYRGCAAIHTMVESADPESPAHQVAARHELATIAYLRDLLVAAGYNDADGLAETLNLLADGAIITAIRLRNARPAEMAKGIAADLLARDKAGAASAGQ